MECGRILSKYKLGITTWPFGWNINKFCASTILFQGMGKTTVFVLATLQQVEPTENLTYALVICHNRVRAVHVNKEYERFAKYMPTLKVGVFIGGLPTKKDEETLKTMTPHIIVGTPGRLLALVRSKKLNLEHLKHFIVDDCETSLEQLGESKTQEKSDLSSHILNDLFMIRFFQIFEIKQPSLIE